VVLFFAGFARKHLSQRAQRTQRKQINYETIFYCYSLFASVACFARKHLSQRSQRTQRKQINYKTILFYSFLCVRRVLREKTLSLSRNERKDRNENKSIIKLSLKYYSHLQSKYFAYLCVSFYKLLIYQVLKLNLIII